jgi:ABC-type glycerol-3-phosphate transport system substrate-binding protein
VEEAKIVQKAVDEFKKAHPGVSVKLERAPFGEYITKVLTQFSAGLAPDVMCLNAEQMPAFATKGVFLDLRPFLDKDPAIRLKDFYPEAVSHYTYEGVLTALPRDIAPVAVVYYNKKIFDEAGLAYPKDDWTLAQFLETAKKLTKRDDVVQFPRGPGKQRAIPLSAAGYSIVKGTKHPELAYELVKYLAGETGQKFMAATGLTQPALKTLAKSPVFLDGLPPKSKGFLVEAVKYGHFQPVDPNEAEWYNMVASALDRVWSGDETAASALAKVTKTVNMKFYKK